MSETKTDEKTVQKQTSYSFARGRMGVIGIDEHVIPASNELFIQSQEALDRPFCCEKMMVIESVPGCSSIVHILAGDRQVVLESKSDPIKSVSFHYKALGNGVDCTVYRDEKIGVLIRNDSAQDIKVAVTIFGHSSDAV